MELLKRRLQYSLACLLTTSCSHSAEVTLRDGSVIEGEIVANDGGQILYLDDESAGAITVQKADVIDVDHPGTTAIATGLGVLTAGTTGAVVGFKNPGVAGITIGILGAAAAPVGLGVSIWGLSAWAKSRNATSTRRATTNQCLPEGAKCKPFTMTDMCCWGTCSVETETCDSHPNRPTREVTPLPDVSLGLGSVQMRWSY